MDIGSIQNSLVSGTEVLLGEWKSGKQQVSIYLHNNAFSSVLSDQVKIDSSRIKCGINGTTSHALFIQRINDFAKEKLQEHVAVFVYPSQGQPEEVWIFEATKMTAPLIKKAKENLKQTGQNDQQTIEWSQKALKNFEIALKIQKNAQGDTAELQTAILQLKKNLFLLNIKQDSHLYLSSLQNIEELNEVIELYVEEENIFSCLSEYVQAFEELSPLQQLIIALVHENSDNPVAAVPLYLNLAEKHSNPLPCLKKAALIAKTASDPFAYPHFLEKLDRGWLSQLSQKVKDPELEDLILHKGAVRMIFEESLRLMSTHSAQTQVPTCFICFNVEEADVGKWLEQILVPDLATVGIKPLFCFRDLGPGKELNNFQSLIRGADQVIVVCTPDLKKKCDESKKAPIGVAQEIRLAQERYNDSEKYETIFPIYLKGERKSACPSVFLEPILGTKFTFEASGSSYYANIFELVGAMRGIPREISRKIKNDFLEKVANALEGEINLDHLDEWKQKRSSSIERILKANQERVSINTQMINLPLPPKDFTGREKEIETLHEACKSQHRVAVTGLGGVGKTALALKYGDEYKSHYQFIHFMPAATSQLVINGLLKLADDLHVPKSEKVEERLDWLKTMLGQFEKEYLVIFDGVDHKVIFEDIEKYLPARGHCLLLTSRMPEQSKIRNYETIELRPFTLEEAINYLLTTTRSKEEEQASMLAEKLGRLPLALKHAAGYIRSQKISIEQYIVDFNGHELELFKNEYLDLTNEEKTILTTWKISINAIEKEIGNPLGKEILEFFAFLGQAPIPLALIEGWCHLAHPTLTRPKLGIALRHLLGYSMIEGYQSNTYDVHALVQSVIRFQMPEEKQKEVYRQAFEVTALLMKKLDGHDVTTWNQTKLCIPHGMALREREKLMNNIALSAQSHLLNQLGMIYSVLGDFQQALKLSQNGLIIAKEWFKKCPNLEESRISVSVSYSNIGSNYYNLEKYDQALESYNESLRIQRQVFGENHSQVAGSYNNIGSIYSGLENYEEAHSFHEKALSIWLSLPDKNDLEVARSYHNIGWVYHCLGEYEKALELYQKVVEIQRQVLGKNHPEMAGSYSNIGLVYHDLGKCDQALKFHQKALEIWRRVIGENYSYVATSHNNIGGVYVDQEKYEEALKSYTESLRIRIQVFGKNHSKVAGSYNNIGSIYYRLGKYDQALESYEKALNIWPHVLKENNPDEANSYSNIGLVYYHLGEYDQALEFYHKALKIQLQVFGENHSKVANSYNGIGVSYDSLGEYEKAFEFLHKAFVIFCKIFKQIDLHILDVLQTLIIVAEKLQPLQLNNLGIIYSLCIETLGIEHEMTKKFNQLISSKNLSLLSEVMIRLCNPT